MSLHVGIMNSISAYFRAKNSFQRVSARRNYELKDELNVSEKGFQRVSARRNYEFLV